MPLNSFIVCSLRFFSCDACFTSCPRITDLWAPHNFPDDTSPLSLILKYSCSVRLHCWDIVLLRRRDSFCLQYALFIFGACLLVVPLMEYDLTMF